MLAKKRKVLRLRSGWQN